ncbi:MAG TPA: VCBS repeat-containing protein [Nannocystaceae bacterium]|nr:VCBS repeat-containing protein [Nannocystaceae bacterium]
MQTSEAGTDATVDDGPLTSESSADGSTTDARPMCDGADDLCHAPQAETLLEGGLAALAIADMDGDLDLDLVIGTYADLGVYLVPGDGLGGLEEASWWSIDLLNGFMQDVALIDYNADGLLDVALDIGQPDVMVLFDNQPDDTLFYSASWNLPNVGPRQLAVDTFDGDARPDLAVVGALDGQVSVYLGSEEGFGAAVDTELELSLQSASIADLDGDAASDLVLTAPESDRVAILAGVGDGSFDVIDLINVGGAPFDAHAADFDGDGLPELAVLHGDGSGISVWPGNAAYTFGESNFYALAGIVSDSAVGDVNDDGVLDLVASHVSGTGVSILVGNGDGTFGAAVEFASTGEMYSVRIADMNADGINDVVAVGDETPGTVLVVLSQP